MALPLRKDLKLGFAAGAAVLVLGVGYVLLAGNDEPANAEARPDPLAGLGAGTVDVGDAPAPDRAPSLSASQADPIAGVGTPEPTPTGQDLLASAGGDSDPWTGLGLGGGPQLTITPAPGEASPPPAFSARDDRASPAPDQNAINREFRDLFDSTAPAAAAQDSIQDFVQETPRPEPTPPARANDAARTPAPTRQVPANLPAGGTNHQIAQNENFSTLAQRYYGDGNLYFVIASANPDVDPRRLKVGQSVTIPDRAAAENARPARPAASAKTATVSRQSAPAAGDGRHVVAPGETLTSIAERRLGRANLWSDIYALNRAAIGDDPEGLQPGMTLLLPQ